MVRGSSSVDRAYRDTVDDLFKPSAQRDEAEGRVLRVALLALAGVVVLAWLIGLALGHNILSPEFYGFTEPVRGVLTTDHYSRGDIHLECTFIASTREDLDAIGESLLDVIDGNEKLDRTYYRVDKATAIVTFERSRRKDDDGQGLAMVDVPHRDNEDADFNAYVDLKSNGEIVSVTEGITQLELNAKLKRLEEGPEDAEANPAD